MVNNIYYDKSFVMDKILKNWANCLVYLPIFFILILHSGGISSSSSSSSELNAAAADPIFDLFGAGLLDGAVGFWF